MSLSERYLEDRSSFRNVNCDEDGESSDTSARSFNSEECCEDDWSPSWFADLFIFFKVCRNAYFFFTMTVVENCNCVSDERVLERILEVFGCWFTCLK